MSSELAGEGENIFRAVGDIILAVGNVMTSMTHLTNQLLDKNEGKQHHSDSHKRGRHVFFHDKAWLPRHRGYSTGSPSSRKIIDEHLFLL